MNLPPRVGQARISMCRIEMGTSTEAFRTVTITLVTQGREAFG
jgi:hypothetical protein